MIGVRSADWTLYEPPVDTYSDELIQNAKDFSNTAVVVIGRVGGEGIDLPTDIHALTLGAETTGTTSTYTNNSEDYEDFPEGTHYLQLSQSELNMIDLVTENFDNVVLLYNGANAFQFDFLEDYPQIKSVMMVPHPGQAGFEALGEILAGTVNPSGRTADTFVADLTDTPSWNNFGDFGYTNVEDLAVDTARGHYYPHFVNYVESIYVGYRWYETAAEEGFLDYDESVVFPFGYGLSYTTFEETLDALTYEDGTITAEITVTNTGDTAGKDVVELYYTPPYTNGGIEKASVNLAEYAKTQLLEPGASESITLTFEDDTLASYDYKNEKAYVVEEGDYVISLRSDSHTVIDEETITVEETIVYNTDDNTHDGDLVAATNLFDDANNDLTYLSRADHFANYAEATAAPAEEYYTMPEEQKAGIYNIENYDPTQFNNADDVMPTMGADNGLKLADMTGLDYDDPQWELLLDELTFEDMDNLIANAGYSNAPIEKIDKIQLLDVDGPAALRNNFTGVGSIGLPANIALAMTWNKDLAYDYGEQIAEMAHDLKISGWYAPSINLHRSAFAGRNFEYFSEDPYLTGTLSAQQVLGAGSKGVYAFVKHFAMNEQETNRNVMLCTWVDEQAMREIYLKAFEISFKAGAQANLPQAAMGAFNYIGNTWASGMTTLNNDLLRGEWGFKGFVETDYFNGTAYGYQTGDQAIRGGTDAMLATTETTNHITDQSATSIIAMRTASKNILYTTANSWRYADGAPAMGTPIWRIMLIVVDVITAAVVILLMAMAVNTLRKEKKTKK